MMKVYVCSPYRAKDGAELDRNIEYAQALTRRALKAGLAPITPHLYITQCLDEKKPQERAQGLAAGMELLKGCDFMIVGDKYGISEGMYREIETAKALFQKGKGCHHCCIRCEYFDICRWDVMTGKTAEQEQTVELLAVEAARKDGNTGLLYQIYKYVEFKKGERRKHEEF